MTRWMLALAAVAALFHAVASAQATAPLQPLDATGRIPFFVAEGQPGSHYRPEDRQLAVWALEAWARAANGTLRFVATGENEALIRVHWVPAAAGQYGEMRTILVGGRRGAEVYIRPDTDALAGDIATLARKDPLLRDAIVYLTCLHELGHALGLAHTAVFDDIMYFFGYGGDIPAFFTRYRAQLQTRADIGRVSGLSKDDVRRVRELYPRR